MKSNYKYFFRQCLIWILSLIITVGIAMYQRMTGPTYPITGKLVIEKQEINFKFPRSSASDGNEIVKIKTPINISGTFKFKRFKSNDNWAEIPLIREGDYLTASIPHQPHAGKVIYNISLIYNNQTYKLSEKDVVIRYRGDVPVYVLIPHIIVIFLSMLFSVRTGFEAIYKQRRVYLYTLITLILFIAGGFILGPLVQKFAFDAYWTGWPIGTDLTDNKVAVSLLFWLIAFVKLRKDRTNVKWVYIAMFVFLIIFLVPHSMLGSEIDYTQQVAK